MNRNSLVAAAVLVLAAPLAACNGTRTVGRPTPGTGMAIVVPETQFNRVRAASPFDPPCYTGEVLVRVCGQRLNGKRRFQVPAGPQALEVAYTNDDTPHNDQPDVWEQTVLRAEAVTMRIDAQAGHTYTVRGRTQWNGNQPRVTLWIVDATDGRMVTSVEVPPEMVKVGPAGRFLGG